jgi:hypothetical protein
MTPQLTRNERLQAMRQHFAFGSMLFAMAPKHKMKGRLTHVQRMILGYSSTHKMRKVKKASRQNRRLGRLRNGRN